MRKKFEIIFFDCHVYYTFLLFSFSLAKKVGQIKYHSRFNLQTKLHDKKAREEKKSVYDMEDTSGMVIGVSRFPFFFFHSVLSFVLAFIRSL